MPLVLLTILFSTFENGIAQSYSDDIWLNKINAAYVKSLDEFIQRFNSEEFHPDIIYEDDGNLKTRSILTLIDWQTFNVEDSNNVNLIIDFADSVCWNDIHLDLENVGIYAEAQCLFDYNGQEISINIVFVFENIRDDFFKWAVAGINGLVESKIVDTSCNGYINPIQHELHFSDLPAACSSDLTRYISVYKTIDQLSFFLGMLKTNQLQFLTCNKVLFHFIQVPDYIFVVDKVNRLDINSGYLINSLLKIEESSKYDYVKQLLGIIEK